MTGICYDLRETCVQGACCKYKKGGNCVNAIKSKGEPNQDAQNWGQGGFGGGGFGGFGGGYGGFGGYGGGFGFGRYF
jgi:hypothetical protein